MKAALARGAVWLIRALATVAAVLLVPLFFALAVVASRMEKPT